MSVLSQRWNLQPSLSLSLSIIPSFIKSEFLNKPIAYISIDWYMPDRCICSFFFIWFGEGKTRNTRLELLLFFLRKIFSRSLHHSLQSACFCFHLALVVFDFFFLNYERSMSRIPDRYHDTFLDSMFYFIFLKCKIFAVAGYLLLLDIFGFSTNEYREIIKLMKIEKA